MALLTCAQGVGLRVVEYAHGSLFCGLLACHNRAHKVGTGAGTLIQRETERETVANRESE